MTITQVNTALFDGTDEWVVYANLSETYKGYIGSETMQTTITGTSFTISGMTFVKQGQENSGTPTTVTITITGTSTEYGCELTLLSSGNQIAGEKGIIVGSTAVFTLDDVIPGTYEVRLYISESFYRIASQTIAKENTIPFSAFALMPPIEILISGIPSQYINTLGGLSLYSSGRWITSDFLWDIDSAVASFSLTGVLPGTYEVRLEFGIGFNRNYYRIPSRAVTAETNTIPYSAFNFMPPIDITITGISSEYNGKEVFLSISDPNDNSGESSLPQPGYGYNDVINGTSHTFTLRGYLPGTYIVALLLDNGVDWNFYRISSKSITAGTNTIMFSAFSPGNNNSPVTERLYDPNGEWSFTIDGEDVTIRVNSDYWEFYSFDFNDYGTFTRDGNVLTLYSGSLDSTIGTATLTGYRTMDLTLVSPSLITGTFNGTRDRWW
jgi:hypothetical protein